MLLIIGFKEKSNLMNGLMGFAVYYHNIGSLNERCHFKLSDTVQLANVIAIIFEK